MIIHDLTGTEAHPVYQRLEVENGNRQYDFLRSILAASIAMQRPLLSQHVVRALNFQAITCLHIAAGEYRPCDVKVGPHTPPPFYRVPSLMEDFVNDVNRNWDKLDPVVLATYVLWKLNNIHPFINGNGRTARSACYFVLCVAAGQWLPGAPILPELIKRDRGAYCDALQKAHDGYATTGPPALGELHGLVSRLLAEQLASAGISPDEEPASGVAPDKSLPNAASPAATA